MKECSLQTNVDSRNIAADWLHPPKELDYVSIPKTDLVLYFKDGHFTTVWRCPTFFNKRNVRFEFISFLFILVLYPPSDNNFLQLES